MKKMWQRCAEDCSSVLPKVRRRGVLTEAAVLTGTIPRRVVWTEPADRRAPRILTVEDSRLHRRGVASRGVMACRRKG